MDYGKFKGFNKRTQSDKVLSDKAFEIASNPKYGRYQRGLASMIYKFFDITSTGNGIKNEIKQNEQLANELHKSIIRKYKKRKVYASFKDNIWGVDLADMPLISKYNKGIKYFYSTKLKIDWRKKITFFKRRISIILSSFSS